MHVEKYSKGASKRILAHVKRERETVTESSIDWSKTKLNRDIVPPMSSEQLEQVSKLAKRKDAVTLVSTILTLPAELKYSSRLTQEKFFEVASKAIHKHIGGTLAYATVHNDETTPHLHLGIIPMTPDGRLCAKEVCNRKMLKNLHPEITKAVQKAGFDNITLYETDEQVRQVEHDLGKSKTSMHEYRRQQYNSQILQEGVDTVNHYLDVMHKDVKHSTRPVKRRKGESRAERKERRRDYVEVRREEYEALQGFVMRYDTVPLRLKAEEDRGEAERYMNEIEREYEKLVEYTESVHKDFARSIEERAQELARKRIAELLKSYDVDMMNRAKQFMQEIMYEDGHTVWQDFVKQEREFQKKLKEELAHSQGKGWTR